MALAPAERRTLHERIEHRFDDMLANGFLEEVAALYQRGDLHVDLPAVRAVGYRQLWSHLSQEYSLEIAREKGIAATRQLAKRQITWLRGWSGLHWLRQWWKKCTRTGQSAVSELPVATAVVVDYAPPILGILGRLVFCGR